MAAIITVRRIPVQVAIWMTITGRQTPIMQRPVSQLPVKIVIQLLHGFHLLSTMTDNISQFIRDRMPVYGIPAPNATQIPLILGYLLVSPVMNKVKQTGSMKGSADISITAMPAMLATRLEKPKEKC